MFWHAIFVLAGLLTVGVGAQPEPEQHNPLEAFQNSQWSSDLSYSAYNISLKVSSTSLPAEGGWVDVTWDNVPYPGSDDLIALYIPADADPRKTTFAKYQWAIASPEHLPHGKGRLRFCLLNMRTDVRFAFIRNPKEWSVIAARSQVISFENPNAPLQGHLALTRNPGEMLVQWTTREEGEPRVHFGKKPGHLEHMAKAHESVTYARDEMCGPPAFTVGYVHPGQMHRAILKDLEPDTEYFYRYGDEEFGFSPETSFVTPPRSGPDASVKLLAIADMGQADIDGSNEAMQYWPSRNTTNLMQRDMDGRRLLLHLGDISYARGYSTQWDVFMDQIEPLARSMPYMTAIGNHERDWPGSGDRFPSMYDSGGECGVPTERRFKMPGPAEDKPWYSFDYGPIHFTIYSTEHHFHHGSEQHDFVKEDLESVDRSHTPWLVVGGHRPFYIDSTSRGKPDSDQTVAEDLRSAFEDLFLRYSVDVTWHGHHHSYQRTCPVFDGQCQGNLEDGSAAAPVHLVIGHAGATTSPNLLPEQPGFWQRVDLVHGFLRVEANATHFVTEMVEDLEGSVMDSFVLRKPYHWRPRDPGSYQEWRPSSLPAVAIR